MLTRLEHPAIVRVLAHGTQDGTPWFAMALVEGSDLRARIAAGALPPAETAAVFGRLFAALAHAHERGIVHRDLKPANVLLGAGGAQLADFGIARLEADMLTGAMATRLTETAAVLGTLPYMSPEQRRGGAIDRRSDLFSAGVMLYEAATGLLPQGAFAPPSELNPPYGRAFDRVVMQLLQADPDRRPASATQAATALASALAPRRFRPVSLAASAAVAVLTLVGGAVGLRAMLRPDGKGAAQALPTALAAPPANAAPASPPSPPRAPEKQAAAPESDEPTEPTADTAPKSAPQETGAGSTRLGKIKRRVVLKTVAEVKKLRANRSAETWRRASRRPRPCRPRPTSRRRLARPTHPTPAPTRRPRRPGGRNSSGAKFVYGSPGVEQPANDACGFPARGRRGTSLAK